MTAISASANPGLPDPGVELTKGNTAIVITDPQNDFLSPDGATWGLVGNSVTANNTVENIHTLFELGETKNIPVFVSPHYYYPQDHKWEHGGALEQAMHAMGMFDRADQLKTKGFRNSGADWLKVYKRYINNGKTVVSNPHKVYGPESNDMVLQLRKRGIDKIILAGMSANLCTEAHMREFMEQGFEVQVVSDATAAAQLPGLDGYAAAMTNVRMIANAVRTTAQTVEQLEIEYK
jgi:nicotinamidase-related amidase